MASLSYIDAVACKNGSQIALALVNRHESAEQSVSIRLSGLRAGLKGTRYYLTGKPDAKNEFGKEVISIQEEEMTLKDEITIAPCTLSMYVLDL